MRGLEPPYVADQRRRARHVFPREILRERVDVELPRHAARGKDGLDLRSEHELLRVDRKVERLDPDMVAGQHHPLPRPVQQRDGKHAVQALREIDPVLLPQVNDDFRIRRRPEPVALRLQLVTQLAVVVDLTVEDYRYAAILIRDRLMAGLQIDDGEAAHAERDRIVHQQTVVVRTAVHQRVAHPLDGFAFRASTVHRDDTGDAAHQAIISRSFRIFPS